jgi:hypothetical protein
MQDNGYVPPMSPDDFAALAAFAGPIYQESRVIESFTSNNPIPNTHDNYGSMNIKQGLEQAQRLAQASVVHPPQPMYVPPAIAVDIPDVTIGTASVTPYPQPITENNFQISPSGRTEIPDQLEFSFNASKQDVTNDLLKEISKKLTKVISLLEVKEDKIPKLKQNQPNAKST